MNIKHILLGLTLVAVPVGALINYSRLGSGKPVTGGSVAAAEPREPFTCGCMREAWGTQPSQIIAFVMGQSRPGPMSREAAIEAFRQSMGSNLYTPEAFEKAVEAYLRVRNGKDVIAIGALLHNSAAGLRERIATLDGILKHDPAWESKTEEAKNEERVSLMSPSEIEALRVDGRAWKARFSAAFGKLDVLHADVVGALANGFDPAPAADKYAKEFAELAASLENAGRLGGKFGFFNFGKLASEGLVNRGHLSSSPEAAEENRLRCVVIADAIALAERIRFGAPVDPAQEAALMTDLRQSEPLFAEMIAALRVPGTSEEAKAETDRRGQVLAIMLSSRLEQMRAGTVHDPDWDIFR